MTPKQRNIIFVFGVVVLAGIVIGILTRSGAPLPASETDGGTGTNSGVAPAKNLIEDTFSASIPAGATLTVPKNEAPASANPALNTKIRFFELKAARSGFAPAELVVNKGDSLSVNFSATDGDYDLDIPYLGAYFSVVKKGETRKLPFDTSIPGTFVFECRAHCPAGGKITGQLIVLP